MMALTLAVAGCGARVDVGQANAGGDGAGAGGATGGQGGCAQPIGSPCECGTPMCPGEPVQGIPCCQISRMCDGEETCKVAWSGAICHDWCDTSCPNAQDHDQCVTIGCKWTDSGCATP